MGELADILRQQNAVQRRNIDIKKNGVNALMLQKLQHIQTVVKRPDNLHLAMFFNQPTEFLLGEEFIFNDDDFHSVTPA